MPTWKRWLKYAKAHLDSALERGNRDLDRREAELEARSAGRPWLDSSSTTPSMEEARARIEHERSRADRASERPSVPSPGPVAPPSGIDPGFELREQQRLADERLAHIRGELGLDPDGSGGEGPEANADDDRERDDGPPTGEPPGGGARPHR